MLFIFIFFIFLQLIRIVSFSKAEIQTEYCNFGAKFLLNNFRSLQRFGFSRRIILSKFHSLQWFKYFEQYDEYDVRKFGGNSCFGSGSCLEEANYCSG